MPTLLENQDCPQTPHQDGNFFSSYKYFFYAIVLAFFVIVSVRQLGDANFALAATTTVSYTSQSDFEGMVTSTGISATTTPGSLVLFNLVPTTTPAISTNNVAVIVGNDSDLDSDLYFVLGAYYPNFSYTPGSGVDDVFNFSQITDVSQLSSYDIVITWATSTTESAQVPQTIVEQFADSGKIVMQNILEYSYQRQLDIYSENVSSTNLATTTGDIAFDGTYIWQMDDTAPESVVTINTTTGQVVDRYCAPNTVPRGIYYLNGFLYISDSSADKIYKVTSTALTPYDGVCATRAKGVTYNLSDLSPAPGSPWGITYDGTNFWMTDSVNKILYQFSIGATTLTQISSTSLDVILTPTSTASVPRGMTYDGTDIWLADSANNMLYKISTSSRTVVSSTDPYDGWTGATDYDPTGIAFVNGELWVLDSDPTVNKLYNHASFYRDKDQYEYFSKGNTSFETPSNEPRGLAYDGTFFWHVDDYANSIYKMTTSGVQVSSCLTPGTRPDGLAYYAGNLYLSDWNTNKIYIINSSTCAVTASYASPGDFPRGLAHDGTYLWNVDSGNDTLYKLNAATGAIISSSTAPGTVSRGLAFDGTNMWVADENDDLYYELSTSTFATLHTKSVSEFTAEGIAFVGGQLWSVDDINDRIYNVDSDYLAIGQYSTPSTSPGGFVYDGANIWSVDSDSDKIYKISSSTGAVLASFNSPANDPRGIAVGGGVLWVTTDSDDKVYQINSSTGVTISSFLTPASDPWGIVYVTSSLYIADPGPNKIYNMSTGGTLYATYDAPGTGASGLAYDGTYVWNLDTDEKEVYKIVFDDDEEGSTLDSRDLKVSSVSGIAFINGDLWMVDTFFDKFYNSSALTSEPTATIIVADTSTIPYIVSSTFYFATRSVTEGFYYNRRLINVPETATRVVLASSSRGGVVYLRETRSNGGQLFVMDISLLGINYETSRQTVPANTLFLNALGVITNPNGTHENSRPTFSTLSAELDTMVSSYPLAFTKVNEGAASDGEIIYSYNFGRSDKPMALFISGVHGNEEHGFIGQIRYMQSLARAYYSGDPTALNIFENYYVKFIPIANPYGVKNGLRHNANGVDLNRNYDYNWSSYHGALKGSAVFSEPETVIIRDIILAASTTLVLENDTHSSMAISPGSDWGNSLVTTTPNILSDSHDIFSTEAARRWYEERANAGRWLTFDRFSSSTDRPYLQNWVGSLNLYGAAVEVMGKKDIGTERMIYTSSWLFENFSTLIKSLSAKVGKAIFRIDTSVGSSTFGSAAVATSTSVAPAFRYSSSSTTDTPTTWYSTYSSAPANRYLFVEVSLTRSSYNTTSPTLDAFEVSYVPPDTTSPVISAVASSTAVTTATITWTTDEVADSQVLYGLTDSYGSTTTLDSTLTSTHSVSIFSLSATTTYHFKVRSTDASGNLASSTDYVFITTSTADTTGPVISSIASSTAVTTATITWTTDEVADSQVVYGLTSAYGSTTTLDSTFTTSHSVSLTGLSEATTYHFKILTSDAGGNITSSTDNILTTTSTPISPAVTTGSSGGGGAAFPVSKVPIVVAPVSVPVSVSVAPCVPKILTTKKYLTYSLRRGAKNIPAEVRRLQTFLREYEGFADLPSTGFFGPLTEKMVIKFQEKYAKDVLKPWGLTKGTGRVMSMTVKKINELYNLKQNSVGTCR